MALKARNETPQRSKEEIYWAVLDAVIRLDIQQGHLMWKITELARASKIGRPLIYYYFGKSKEEILKTAIQFLGEEYFGLSSERLKLWKAGQVFENVLRSRLLCQKAPYVPVYYLTRRHLDSFVGKSLRSFESRYRKKLEGYSPNLSPSEIAACAAVLFGLAAAPDVSEEGLKSTLEKLFSRGK